MGTTIAYEKHVRAELATNTCTPPSPATRGGWRLDRAARADKIDGVVALAMAVERAEHRAEPVRILGWL